MSAIFGDLPGRRGRVAASDLSGRLHLIVADVPLANMFNYVNTLRSLSQGRGTFTMRPAGYAPVRQPAAVC